MVLLSSRSNATFIHKCMDGSTFYNVAVGHLTLLFNVGHEVIHTPIIIESFKLINKQI